MKRQCECAAQADEIVFGLSHQCEPHPAPVIPERSLVPSWRLVVPESDPHDLEMRANPYDMDDDERRGH